MRTREHAVDVAVTLAALVVPPLAAVGQLDGRWVALPASDPLVDQLDEPTFVTPDGLELDPPRR